MISKKDCTTSVCSHSIGRRLSGKLALVTMLVFGALFFATWMAVNVLVLEKNAEDLRSRTALIQDIIELEAKSGGEAAVLDRLHAYAPMRGNTRLEIHYADGRPCYIDPTDDGRVMSEHTRSQDFTVQMPDGTRLDGRFTMDFASDARMGNKWAVLLVALTLAAGAFVAGATSWHVRRQLRPLHDLAAQTRAISPRRLDQRLSLVDPGEELLPWIEQFNALMQRLELAYSQLEGFNADVAHELRTPLATLIGETEVALSRERSADSLRETLASNLEEMQRLSAMVNDMLFLSNADRGAQARRGVPVSLATLARQVAEFHEGTLDEAGLRLDVVGDATVAVDEPLVKRALSAGLHRAGPHRGRGAFRRAGGGAEPGARHCATTAAPLVRPLLPRRRVPLLRWRRTAPRPRAGDRGRDCAHARRAHPGTVRGWRDRGRLHRGRLNGGGVCVSDLAA
jgi:two-component system, OmpR family, heavy metal sensor histidine kinase CusS